MPGPPVDVRSTLCGKEYFSSGPLFVDFSYLPTKRAKTWAMHMSKLL
jgi:hypothetical protein